MIDDEKHRLQREKYKNDENYRLRLKVSRKKYQLNHKEEIYKKRKQEKQKRILAARNYVESKRDKCCRCLSTSKKIKFYLRSGLDELKPLSTLVSWGCSNEKLQETINNSDLLCRECFAKQFYKKYVGDKFNLLTIISLLEYKNKRFMCLCECECGNNIIIRIDSVISKKTISCGCITKTKFLSKYIILQVYTQLRNLQYSREVEFNITPEELDIIWDKQNGKCYFTGLPITLPRSSEEFNQRKFTASLDRIDNNIGHISSNVRWSHKDINKFKLDKTDEEFIEWCRLIANKDANNE